ncbi:TonB-dependent receptor [Arenibacter sp. M-2]|uniref:TonB-dependent receptor n=1 Tax=Arenibacter sp. M-2 TaxID=3053612 RepID=UPI00257078EE|nr:TonB-dependent receptor [Arenibacter sp. M-2]MDL5514942.1 TonB-dependent receptor [Arenibacter sp. M-2]
MKLSVVLLIIGTFVLQANSTYSQKKISLKLTNITVERLLDEIESKTDFRFVYSTEDVDMNRRVDVDARRQKVGTILKAVFAGTKTAFSIDDGQIFLLKDNETKPPLNKISPQDPIRITGKVTDSEGVPLPGATVLEKGTSNGVAADFDGNYEIHVSGQQAVLVFTNIGFQDKEAIVGNQTSINIELDTAVSQLDDVVVIGYGSQRKELLTSAVSEIEITEDNLRPTLSPAKLLDGRMAGVQIGNSSGNLGAGETLRIRGAASLSASTEPLYVIDGVPITNSNAAIFNLGESMSALATISLNDIESISVLKDAASAAIYGSRATNGVVVITTKRGKEGKSQLNINLNSGVSQFADPDKIKFSNSELYVEVLNEGIDNYNKQNGYTIGDSGYVVNQQNPFQGLPDTDWLDVITQNGEFVNLDMSVSGGSKKTNFYVGGNYTEKEGVIKGNKIEKVNLKVNLNHDLFSWLTIGTSTSGNYLKNYRVPGANIGSTIVARAVEQRPYDRVYKPNGEYYFGGTNQLLRHNPIQILNEQEAYVDNLRFLGNVYAKVDFTKNLSWKTSFSTDIFYTYDYVYYNENHPYGTGVGRLVEYDRLLTNNITENLLNYNFSLIDGLETSFMLGHSFQRIGNRSSKIDARGFPSPSFDVSSVASEVFDAYGTASDFAMESYFGRATFSYKDKYVLNSSLRSDGSSRFSKDNRWALFPSISLGWNISKEDFFKDSRMNFKFRTSYGETGNQDGIGYFAYQPLISGGYNYGGESGIAVGSFGNEDLSWESTKQFDVGVDVGFWDGKVNFMLDYYVKNTEDLLYSTPIQTTSGTSSILTNVGSIQNNGIEFTLNSHFNFGKLQWNSQFNISSNKNKITKLNNEDGIIPIGGNKALEVGKEIGAWYFFEMEGLYQYDGDVPQEQYNLGVRAGDVKWNDVDGNGIINDDDRVIKGSPSPDFYGGWNNTFKYKGFQLDVFTTFMFGNDVYASWKQRGTGRVGYINANLEETVKNRWTGPGTSNEIPRSIWGYHSNNARNSDMWLEDGSFIRLRTLTLSYNFKQGFMGLNKLRVYAQGDNLLLFTNYSGWDPEVNTSLDPRFLGNDNYSVPQPRTISVGVNVSL